MVDKRLYDGLDGVRHTWIHGDPGESARAQDFISRAALYDVFSPDPELRARELGHPDMSHDPIVVRDGDLVTLDETAAEMKDEAA